MERVKIESLRDLQDSRVCYGLEIADLRLLERAVKEKVGTAFVARYRDYETDESYFRLFLLNKGKGICLCQCDLDDWLHGWSRDTEQTAKEVFRIGLTYSEAMQALCESGNYDLLDYYIINWSSIVGEIATGKDVFMLLLKENGAEIDEIN